MPARLLPQGYLSSQNEYAGEPIAFERLVRRADLEKLAVVGGRERTAAEYERLFADSGFALTRIVPLEGMPWSVIEGVAV